jgi:hypothetical protein
MTKATTLEEFDKGVTLNADGSAYVRSLDLKEIREALVQGEEAKAACAALKADLEKTYNRTARHHATWCGCTQFCVPERETRQLLAVTNPGQHLLKELDAAKATIEDLRRSNPTHQWHAERDARIKAEGLLKEARETLEETLTGVVMTIAFLGRDVGTDRMEKTAQDLIAEAAKLDPKIRAAVEKLSKRLV